MWLLDFYHFLLEPQVIGECLFDKIKLTSTGKPKTKLGYEMHNLFNSLFFIVYINILFLKYMMYNIIIFLEENTSYARIKRQVISPIL